MGIPRRDIEVDFFPPKGFLLLLPSPDLRDRGLSCNDGFSIGRAKLQLLPWTRLVGAEAAKLAFKVPLCVEGVPHHAQQQAAIKQLLPRGSLFEGLNSHFRSDKEAACCCVSVWSRNPDEFALAVILRLEELQVLG
jgi:hypothetical protein